MEAAWRVFDMRGEGELNTEEFSQVLPLLGEDVPEEEIDALFEMADADGSGLIEYEEFKA